jgi:hypothetical protein
MRGHGRRRPLITHDGQAEETATADDFRWEAFNTVYNMAGRIASRCVPPNGHAL